MLLNSLTILNLTELYTCMSFMYQQFDSVYSMYVYDHSAIFVDEVSTIAVNLSSYIVHLKTSKSNVYINKKTMFYSILSSDMKVIEDFFRILTLSESFEPRANYFVMYFGVGDVDTIFKVVARLYLQRIVLLDRHNNLYTAMPYQFGCGRYTCKKLIGSCRSVNADRLEMVFNQTVADFRGCSVKVLSRTMPPYVVDTGLVKKPGAELEILRKAAKQYNFSLEYVNGASPSLGYKLSNRSYTDLLHQFEARGADILLGGIRANYTYLVDFTSSETYFPSHYHFYVPAAQKVSKWNSLAFVFNPIIWLLAFVAILAERLTSFCHSKLLNSSIPTLAAFGVVVDQGVRKPKPRLLFIIWVWYSFVVTSSYKAKLLSFLIQPMYGEQLNSYEDIVASNLLYGGIRYSRTYFKDSTDPAHRLIYKNWLDCPLGTSCINRTVFNRDFAMLENELVVRYYRNGFLDNNLRPRYHEVSSRITTYSWMLMQKGLPVQYAINNVILSAREFGFLDLLLKSYLPKPKQEKTTNFKVISIDDILLIFFVYVGSSLIAFGMFAFEYLSVEILHLKKRFP